MKASFEYMIHNGLREMTVDMKVDINSCSVYEVVRVIGKPVYLKEHIDRLNKSLKLLGIEENLSYENLNDYIKDLSEFNGICNNNVKILCVLDDDSIKDIYIYHIESNYPDEQKYDTGVKTIFYNVERENPNIKIHRPQLKDAINAELKANMSYEALLVDHNDNVTEGSRSNLLFIEGNSVVTSKSENVLLGVTRNKVIEICNNNGISVVERDIYKSDVEQFDAAFITGTSINVLPVNGIGDTISFDTNNKVLRDIMNLFERDFKKDIQ